MGELTPGVYHQKPIGLGGMESWELTDEEIHNAKVMAWPYTAYHEDRAIATAAGKKAIDKPCDEPPSPCFEIAQWLGQQEGYAKGLGDLRSNARADMAREIVEKVREIYGDDSASFDRLSDYLKEKGVL